VAVVINDFEVVPSGGESTGDRGQQDKQTSAPAAHEIEKQIAEWLHKRKERSLRNWAH
jgi:hypothetical protein